jgi:hypothetical protein
VLWLPEVMFNDSGLTLDGYSAARIAAATGHEVSVVSCSARGLLARLDAERR